MNLRNLIVAAFAFVFSMTILSAGMDVQQQRMMIASQIIQTQQQLTQKHRDAEILKTQIKDLTKEINSALLRPTQMILLKTQKAKAQQNLNNTELQIKQLTKNQNDLFEIQKTINR